MAACVHVCTLVLSVIYLVYHSTICLLVLRSVLSRLYGQTGNTRGGLCRLSRAELGWAGLVTFIDVHVRVVITQ